MTDNIIKLLNDIFSDIITEECEKKEEKNDEQLDLTNDKDYEKFNKYVDECKSICEDDSSESKLTTSLFDSLFGVSMSNLIDEIKNIGDEIHEKAVKERKKTKKIPELPSKSTSLEMQSQLHKIVGEYVDTYIRPYGNMDRKVVDDAYAGLFEFACWVMNR